MDICLLAGCTFFTGFPGSTKCPVDPVSSIASCLDICIIDVEYAVSICLLFQLLMMTFFSHPHHWLLVAQIYLWYCLWCGTTS